jgi:ABC-type branched-subunit amino acid transport system substrate-binding protein
MRESRRRYLAFAAGSAVVAMLMAACGSSGGGSGTSGNSGGSGSSASPSSGSGSEALTASAPGITPTTVLIGSHQPLTGPAAPGYSEISPASKAYFDYVNANGGIYGRKINYK